MKTYSLIEAVKSGRRFRPENSDDVTEWLYVEEDGELDPYVYYNNTKQKMNVEMITAKYVLEDRDVFIKESDLDIFAEKVIEGVLDGSFHSIAVRKAKESIGITNG